MLEKEQVLRPFLRDSAPHSGPIWMVSSNYYFLLSIFKESCIHFATFLSDAKGL